MRRVMIAIAIGGSLVLAACSNSSTTTTTTAPTVAETTTEAPATAGDGVGATEDATVTASNFAFSPSELSIDAGTDITFTNDDTTAHTFTVDDTDVDVEVQPGESASVPTGELDSGDYSFHCRFHSQMTGTLTVN